MTEPTDFTPAEPEPPTLLEQLHRSVGLAELHAAINNHRTTTQPEED
jgi:hypothetical protein